MSIKVKRLSISILIPLLIGITIVYLIESGIYQQKFRNDYLIKKYHEIDYDRKLATETHRLKSELLDRMRVYQQLALQDRYSKILLLHEISNVSFKDIKLHYLKINKNNLLIEASSKSSTNINQLQINLDKINALKFKSMQEKAGLVDTASVTELIFAFDQYRRSHN